MKIAVLNNCVPFLHGGAEHLAEALTAKLNEFGHEAVLIRVPFRWDPPSAILENMLACRMLRLPNVERVIALKFPVYLVPHENKVLWLLHQFRQAYDLWGTELQGLPDSTEGVRIKDSIHFADSANLSKARKIYTNSKVTSQRLLMFNGIASEVLWPPLLETDHLRCAPSEDFVFYPSRVNRAKRQILAVEAMKFVKSPVRLILAGAEEDPAEKLAIETLIERDNLSSRVHWLRGFVPEEVKADHLSRALGVLYIPYDEDSYGYVTLEAYYSQKPVITCTDSGGTDVVVKDKQTGFITPPQSRQIADAIDRLYQNKAAARTMGANGFELVERLGITWPGVIRALTA